MTTNTMHKNNTMKMYYFLTKRFLVTAGLSLVLLFVGIVTVIVNMQPPLPEKTALVTADTEINKQSALVQNYVQLPLRFEQNKGQSYDQIHYLSQGKGFTLYLTPTESIITLNNQRDNKVGSTTAIKTRLVDADIPFNLQGQNKLPGKVNYLIGRDKSHWITDIPTYAEVTAKKIYPGIDLRYYGDQQQQLEYDFIVAPGANTERIKLRFEGVNQLTLNNQGDLILHTEGGKLHHKKPYIYQDINGQRIEIQGQYVFHPLSATPSSIAEGKVDTKVMPDVGFDIAAYNPVYPLIIDPVLDYSTYLGGNADDSGLAIAVDNSGSAYVAGTTLSTTFPTASPYQSTLFGSRDAFIAKLNPAGDALVYSTYFGGSGNDGEDENDDSEDEAGEDDNDDNDDGDSDNDRGMDIAVDSNGYLYITGTTNSATDFPIANAFQTIYGGGDNDAYVAKLSPDGSNLVFSTYLGGSDKDKGFGIALDTANNIYLTGMTRSNDFPVVNAVQAIHGGAKDAYIAKLSSDGSNNYYVSYIGGSKSDTGKAIAVNSQGQATITGVTKSKNNFPLHNAIQPVFGGGRDAFVSQLSSDGSSFNYSTFIGGSKKDKGRGIAIDSQDNVFIVGMTKSKTDFPLVNALQTSYGGGSDDGFISKLSSDGSLLTFSTYLGGEKTDKLRHIAFDNEDQFYVVGTTKSTTGIPITDDAIQAQLNGSKRDVFITQISNDGSTVIFGSYFGGTKNDRGKGIAVNNQDIYITGTTQSDQDFPVQNALQAVFGGDNKDAFIARFSGDNSAPEITSTPNITAIVGQVYSYDVDATDPDQDTLLYSLQVSPVNMVIDSITGVISWLPDSAGNVSVTVLVDDNNGNGKTDTQSYTLTVTADDTPPIITVTSPIEGSQSNNSLINLTGFLDKTATLTINGLAVTLNSDLSFNTPVLLVNQGNNTITLTAVDVNGNSATTTLNVVLDTQVPIITLVQPSSTNSFTNQEQLTITGSLNETANLTFNSVSVPVNTDRSFSIGPITLATGLNSFTLSATDSVGNITTQNINITLDTVVPVLTIDNPLNNTLTNQADVLFSGSVTKPVNLTLNGQAILQNSDNSFNTTITLGEGLNNVVINATDPAGNTDTALLNINVDTTPPVLDSGLVNRGNAQNQIVMVAGVAGAVEPGALVHVINPVNGFEARVLSQSDGSFSTDVAGFANDSFQVFAVDAAGNQSDTINLSTNTPPSLTLDTIGNKIAPLGQTSRFTVTANDNLGNPITLGISPVPLPAGMEYNITTGEFSFSPSKGQEGDYSLTFSAVNGDERVVETLNITVPATSPTDTTAFTGRVLDANSFTQGSLIPVVGAKVAFLGSNVTATTDVDGYFSLTALPVDAVLFDIDANTAQTAPDGSGYASFREGLTLEQNVVNQEERPFFLPRINTGSLTQVDPTITTVVNNSDLDITLTVPPHTAKNADGSDFTGQLSISEVPLALAPVALPDTFQPALLITVQPVGVTYSTPVAISYPNVDNLPADTEIDLYQVDRDLGKFVITGIGQVSSDGLRIETISGGVTANTWGAPAPAGPNKPAPNNPKTPDPDNPPCNCNTKKGGSTIGVSDGRMGTNFSLPAYRSLETSRVLTFKYQSSRALSKPVLPFNIGIARAIPNTISYSLTVAGLKQGKTVYISAAGLARNSVARSGFAFDGDDFASGQYSYELSVSNNFNSTRIGNVFNGILTVENEEASAFGAGWLLEGLYRLAFNPDGSITLIAPAGHMTTYRPNGVTDQFDAPESNFAIFNRNSDGSYTHTEKNGLKMHFGATGLISKHEDRNNNITAYGYDVDDKLITITDPVGLITNLDYDTNGILQSVTDPASRVTLFTHDAVGNLRKVTFPDSTFEEFEYTKPETHLISARFDERRNRYTYNYDNFGRIIDSTLPDGTVRAAANQTSKGLIDLESGLGTATNPAPVVRGDEVDADYVDGRGNASSQLIDPHGRTLMAIDEVGRVTEHQRDADSNPTQTTRAIGSVVTRTFDDFGNVLTQKEEFNTATTSYLYDNFSLVTQVTNPRNHTTTINRDPANGNPLSIVNHLLHTTIMEYDARGLVERQVSLNGLETIYTYNAQGLMESKTETPPTGSPGNIRLWTYDYFPSGLLQTVNTPDGITLNYTYDERSDLISVTDNLNQTISYSYDEHKNVVKTETQSSDDSLALLVDSIYDNRNRLTETRSPHVQVSGETTEESITQRILDENSNLIEMVDPNGNASSNNYDPYNRLASNTHRELGITTYQYDDQDRIIKIIAPNEVTTDYEYDIISRKTKEISPDRGTVNYAYDLANNIISITEGRGITATMTYDELERIKSKTYPNTVAGKVEDVTYTYDTCAFGLGYLCARDDESGNYDYTYDAYSNMTNGTFTEISGIVYTTNYEYDDGNHITQMTMPSGRIVNYSRDGVRRINAIDTTLNGIAQNIVSNVQYRGDNQMLSCSYGNGTKDTRAYDLQGRLRSQQLDNSLDTLIDQRIYSYDKNSNILNIDSNTEDNVYSYDKLDRITQDAINADTPNNFSYDLNDNRQSKAKQDLSLEDFFTYQENNNRVSEIETVKAGATPIENLVGREMVYNDVGRLFQLIEDGNLKAEYIYNDQGQRTRKTVYQADGVSIDNTTIYHYDQMGYLITETTETGQLIKDYIWQEGMHPLAQIESNAGIENIIYLYTDHLMTNRLATDEAQNIIWRWEGEAFGNTPAQELAGVSVNLRFPGQYFDGETGLHYNYFRYYDPSTGRYITSDPIGLDGGLNTYAYVKGNPLRWIDPFGLIPCLSCHDGFLDWYNPPPSPNQNTIIWPDNLGKPIDPWNDTNTVVEVPTNTLPPEIPDQCEIDYKQDIKDCNSNCSNLVSKALCAAKAKLKRYVCQGKKKPNWPDDFGSNGGDPGYSGF